jgi:hypothetical protein
VSTAASAISMDVDQNTKVDLDQPPRCDVIAKDGGQDVFAGIFGTGPAALGDRLRAAVENPDAAENPRWPTKASECSSSAGGDTHHTPGADGDPSLGTSNVECPAPGGELLASGEARLAGDAVSVGRAFTQTRLLRDETGIHAEVESVAQDITFFGSVTVAEIRSVARSRANGRPSADPLSSREVSVRGLAVNGGAICVVCDPAAVVDVLNTALAERAEFRLGGGDDGELARGTPAGAQTAVQKSNERRASDTALFNDNLAEVPALEMITFNDNPNWGRSRQLYQFAGVASSASYSISLVPTGTGLGAGGLTAVAGGVVTPGGPLGATPAVATGPAARPERRGGVLGRIPEAIAEGLRFILTHPREAMLLMTAWALFAAPFVLGRRRRALREATA